MFGTYRTLLALMVVGQHIGGLPLIGSYAVFGFYALSGYLMTFIMQNNYGYSHRGIGRYALNRFLRIYPIYWVSIAISASLVLGFGHSVTAAYHQDIYLPADLPGLLRNLLLFFPLMESPRLTPPAWALTVELCFYILIGLGLSRTRRLTVAWFLISILYHLFAVVSGRDTYFTVFAASLPFSTGALICHFRTEIAGRLDAVGATTGRWLPVVGVGLVLGNWLLGAAVAALETIAFYANYLLCAVLVAVLASRRSLPLVSPAIDRWLGDLSYPIYLLHYQVALVVMLAANALGLHQGRPSLALLAFAAPFVVAAAWLLSASIEGPIERVRRRVKDGLPKGIGNPQPR